jgi:hypothetical protein
MAASTKEIKPRFAPEITFEVSSDVLEERTTIVHCILLEDSFIRIWPTTYLVQDDGVRKPMIQAFNIVSYPNWKLVPAGHRFTLVFEGLDKGCSIFELVEDIPEPAGFRSGPLQRNSSDVYSLEVKE